MNKFKEVIKRSRLYRKIKKHFERQYYEMLNYDVEPKAIELWAVDNDISVVMFDEASPINLYLIKEIQNTGVHIYLKSVENNLDVNISNFDFELFSDVKQDLCEKRICHIGADEIKGIRNVTVIDFCKEIHKYKVNAKLQDAFAGVEKKGVRTLYVKIPLQMPENDLHFEKVTEAQYKSMSNNISWEEFKEIRNDIMGKPGVFTYGKLKQYSDYFSVHVNFMAGERIIPNQIYHIDRPTVYVVGPCIVAGLFADDKHTIGAGMKRYLGDDYNVKVFGCGEVNLLYHIRRVENLPVKAGDVVVFVSDCDLVNEYSNVLDLEDAFNECFISDKPFYYQVPVHCNEVGYDIIAQKICQIIKAERLEKSTVTNNNVILSEKTLEADRAGIADAIQKLTRYKKQTKISGGGRWLHSYELQPYDKWTCLFNRNGFKAG